MDILRNLAGAAWIGSLISLAGLIAAILLYRAARIGGRPVFQIGMLRLLSKARQQLPAEIEILYEGERVTKLSRVQIAFWNSGKSIIRGADIVEDDALRFVFDTDGVVLNSVVVKSTRTSKKFNAVVSGTHRNEVLYSFDYLDPGDGALLDVLHTGTRGSPDCVGTIRGVPAGPQDWGTLGSMPVALVGERLMRFSRFMDAAAFSLGLFLLGSAYFVSSWVARVPLILLGAVYLVMGVSTWRERRRAPRLLRIDESWNAPPNKRLQPTAADPS